MSQEISTKDRADRINAALEWGRQLCRDNGIEPKLGLIIWELMVEAAETLQACPDPEAAWLRSGGRSSMPEIYREPGKDYADNEGDPRRAIPQSAQISRMEEVLSWFEFFKGGRGGKRRRDLQAVFSLAMGLDRHIIAARAKVKPDTLYSIRDRQLRAVAFEINRLRRV